MCVVLHKFRNPIFITLRFYFSMEKLCHKPSDINFNKNSKHLHYPSLWTKSKQNKKSGKSCGYKKPNTKFVLAWLTNFYVRHHNCRAQQLI